ncbi:DegV family protein [Eisenbergiella sp.]
MNSNFQIISDGSCDLPPELAKKKHIRVVPFYVSFDDKNYKKEIEEIGIREFYQKMVDNPGVYPKSSLPSIQDYYDAFEPYAREKIPVFCICITTKFSGSMQSALSARDLILETYPDAVITVMDATVNTVLQGLLVLEAAAMQESGAGYEETIARISEIRSSGRIFFTVGNMEYLKAGGRIGKVAGAAGALLGIKPIITLKEGEIFPSGIGRVRKKTMLKTIDLLLAYLHERPADIDCYSIAVGYGYDRAEAEAYRELVLERLRGEFGEVALPVYQIGATIGVHTGPYPLGLGIVEKALPGNQVEST